MAMNDNDTVMAKKGIHDDSVQHAPARRMWGRAAEIGSCPQFHGVPAAEPARPALFQGLFFTLDLGCDHPRIVRNQCASQTLIVNPTSAT